MGSELTVDETRLSFDLEGARVSLGSPDREGRVYHWFVSISLVLIGMAITSAGISELGTSEGTAFLTVGLACLVGSEVFRRFHGRGIDPGFISADDSHLVINHPALFSQPLQVPVKQIRAAVVDDTGQDDAAFAVYGDPDGPLASVVREHLWNAEEMFPLSRLGRRPRKPNVVILFDAPMVAQVSRGTPHGPRRKEGLAGIAASVPHPEEARHLFEARGFRGILHEGDVIAMAAIHSGEIRNADPSVATKGEADASSTWAFGWGLAWFGCVLPFVSIWSLLIARKAWKAREHAHALGISMLAVTVLVVEVLIVTNPPVEQSWRFSLGIAVTLLPIALVAVVLVADLVRGRPE